MNKPFPTIRTLSDVLPHIAAKPEIHARLGPLGSTVVCYQFQDSDTFDNAYAAECRGIVFDRDGNIAARPLHKFFNVGERPGTQPDLESAVRVMDKRDGSMIHTVWLDGQLLLKSKKCFDNSQVKMAWEWLRRPENAGTLQMCIDHSIIGCTVIFELTSPANRIVVGYEDTDLRLLHIRLNDTGDYLPSHLIGLCAQEYGVPMVDEPKAMRSQLLESLVDMKGREGYVLQFADGDMVKAKCAWYLNLHRTLSFTRERDIAEAALEERLDDIKSALATINIDLEAVNAIEKRVKASLLEAQKLVDTTLAAAAGLDRKAFALQYRDHAHFGMLMAAFVGKEPDFKEWFRRHVLKQDYSLEPVGAAVIED
jgi:RNA ligase